MNETSLGFVRRSGVIRVKDATKVVLAVTMLLSVGPFFSWETYAGGLGSLIFKGLEILNLFLLLASINWKKIAKVKFFSSVGMIEIYILFTFFTGVKGGTYLPLVSGNVLTFSTFAVLIMCDPEILSQSFGILKNIYFFIICYTLLIYQMVIIGLPIPNGTLQSAEPGRIAYSMQYYVNYLGCLFIHIGSFRMDRFTSVFTEPGVVGTLSVFFLVASDFDLKKDKRNIVILLAGIFSYSLAFILLMVVYFIARSARNGSFRVVALLSILLLTYIVFINMRFNNYYLTELQNRLSLGEGGLAGDNRIHKYAQEQYELFLHSDIKTVLFGYGNAYIDPSTNLNFWQGTATYKRQIFQFGILGFGVYLVWTILAPICCFKTKDSKNNAKLYTYVVVFVASMYQRPQITTLFFIYFLIAGCTYAIDTGQKRYYTRQTKL